jgi:hypothetical protein
LITASSRGHGTTLSISAKNCVRRVTLVLIANPTVGQRHLFGFRQVSLKANSRTHHRLSRGGLADFP